MNSTLKKFLCFNLVLALTLQPSVRAMQPRYAQICTALGATAVLYVISKITYDSWSQSDESPDYIFNEETEHYALTPFFPPANLGEARSSESAQEETESHETTRSTQATVSPTPLPTPTTSTPSATIEREHDDFSSSDDDDSGYVTPTETHLFANIDHLLAQELSRGHLHLNLEALEKGINGVCTWQQLHRLTHMLCQASLQTALTIDLQAMDLEGPNFFPQNSKLQALWDSTSIDENYRWLALLFATVHELENINTTTNAQIANDVAQHILTLIIFFDFFAPMNIEGCDTINLIDPCVAADYIVRCFKRLYTIKQVTNVMADAIPDQTIKNRIRLSFEALKKVYPHRSFTATTYRTVTTDQPLARKTGL